MLEKNDAAASDGAGGNGGSSSGLCPAPVPRKTYWRSASWSTSRTMLLPHDLNGEKDSSDPNGNNGGRGRFNVPSTPRTQGNSKARALLPPLQPLAISRRSLNEWPKAGSDDVGEWPLPCTPGGRDMSNGGDRLKLDLSSIRSNPDKNSGLLKKDKLLFFDKECSKVAKHIYLGGDAVARDREILGKHGITHILNCVGFVCPEYFKADFVYHTLWLQDSPSEDITSILYDVFDYFEYAREQQGRVFVHCCQGVSRSTSLVIAYLMWREGQSFDEAFQYVKAARGIADPNMGFTCQLLQCQKRVHAFPLSPSSLLRMYRIASHSSYDPLHLVPKMLNSPTPAALDSRGAFIIHIPSAIYVWIGMKCETIMERDARGAVCQIVRFEKVRGVIVAIKEGEEPSYFWDAFSDLLSPMDKSSNGVDVIESSKKIFPGERKVSSYNVEFEIFQKAIVGGFVPPSASSVTDHETHLPVRESCWSTLRRKLTSGSMKEFASASKSSQSRVYPDSVLKLCAENCPSKTSLSPRSISTSPEFVEVNFKSGHCSQSVSPPSKKHPLSIAERRGSMAKNLNLPMPTDDSREKYDPLSGVSGKNVGVRMKIDNCSPCQRNADIKPNGEKDSDVKPMSQGTPNRVTSVKEAAFDRTSTKRPGNVLLDAKCSNDFSGLVDCNLAGPKQNQLVVCRWPSLEKTVTFCAADLDSKDIFVLVASASGLGKILEHRVLYFWVGKCISHGNGKMLLKGDQDTGELEEINWHEVSYDVITKMGLPNDTNVKIVKQDEEPEEFLALLGSL